MSLRMACPHCGSAIPEQDQTAPSVKCRECRGMLDLGCACVSGPWPPPPVNQPSAIEIRNGNEVAHDHVQTSNPENEPAVLTLVRHWHHAWWRVLAILLLGVGCIVFPFLLPTARQFRVPPTWALLAPVLFPLGLLCVYLGLAGWVQKTVIQVTPRRLTVHHVPLPWVGQRRFEIDDIKALWCVARDHRNHPMTFGIRIAFKRGMTRVLISGLPDRSQARFIQQELTKALGLDWVRVASRDFSWFWTSTL
jgi:hypothetical protein